MIFSSSFAVCAERQVEHICTAPAADATAAAASSKHWCLATAATTATTTIPAATANATDRGTAAAVLEL